MKKGGKELRLKESWRWRLPSRQLRRYKKEKAIKDGFLVQGSLSQFTGGKEYRR